MVKYHTNDYGSINTVIDTFSTDMFDSLTFVVRPVVGGIGYLRHMHQAYQFQRSIERISNLDYEQRDRILDILSDMVVNRIDDEEFAKELEQKISELDEMQDIFKELNYQKSNIEKSQMQHVFRISLRRFNGRIVSIRDEINSKMWDSVEDIPQLLVLDQVFFLIQETVKALLDEPIDKTSNPKLNKLTYSLLYIEAFHRGKVTFEDFQDFLSDLTLFNYKEGRSLKNNEAVFETLAV
ncbi:hypothetical protein [Methanomethylovorans sp.]|uniref:hypothetical protein n=1 Tax=Methanomethylovorans sp. TaxID=2758717 RepID=UPI00351C5392